MRMYTINKRYIIKFNVMYRHNVMSGRKSCDGNDLVGWLATLATLAGRAVRIQRSIYSPCNSRRESSCFTRQTSSHPAHTSNLGKVGTSTLHSIYLNHIKLYAFSLPILI